MMCWPRRSGVYYRINTTIESTQLSSVVKPSWKDFDGETVERIMRRDFEIFHVAAENTSHRVETNALNAKSSKTVRFRWTETRVCVVCFAYAHRRVDNNIAFSVRPISRFFYPLLYGHPPRRVFVLIYHIYIYIVSPFREH